MSICKHYINGKCTNPDCKYQHIDNICRNYYFDKCTRINCKFSHDYKLQERQKNTECFTPNYDSPSMRVIFNNPIKNNNEISIIDKLFDPIFDYHKALLNEISHDVYIPWHGESHLIANDKSNENWKDKSPTFNNIINTLCDFFHLTPSATRLNFYDKNDWKPYHHDAAAINPEKAKYQNITVGVSFGSEREISFQSAEYNKTTRKTINFPLENCIVYAFGNKINTDFRHGIPPTTNMDEKGRISIIIWGFSTYLLN